MQNGCLCRFLRLLGIHFSGLSCSTAYLESSLDLDFADTEKIFLIRLRPNACDIQVSAVHCSDFFLLEVCQASMASPWDFIALQNLQLVEALQCLKSPRLGCQSLLVPLPCPKMLEILVEKWISILRDFDGVEVTASQPHSRRNV